VKRVAVALAALVAAGAAVAGCGDSSSGGGVATDKPPASVPLGGIEGCTPDELQTVSPGVITIGVDQPVYPPWFNDNKNPVNGEGYESAVDLAIAKKLGYTPEQIKLKRISFTQAIGPGARSFDFDLDEFSITKARQKAVDFSAPYYDVAEAVVAMKGTKAATVTSLAALTSLKLGAQSGSTNQQTISQVIKPSKSAFFGSNALAVQALKNGQIDALVVDLPTAFYITAAQVKGSVIVGQLPVGSDPEQFGALLAKDSPLTSCVSKAVLALKDDGTLAGIEDKWLAKEADAPVLQ
jgi:polar amino acid transport system substrate-binding protein